MNIAPLFNTCFSLRYFTSGVRLLDNTSKFTEEAKANDVAMS
jgi:hypothetical protein